MESRNRPGSVKVRIASPDKWTKRAHPLCSTTSLRDDLNKVLAATRHGQRSNALELEFNNFPILWICEVDDLVYRFSETHYGLGAVAEKVRNGIRQVVAPSAVTGVKSCRNYGLNWVRVWREDDFEGIVF